MYSITITFGRSTLNGSPVTDHQWNSFVRDHIVPRFNSFTLTSHVGYWQGVREISESCRVLVDWADINKADEKSREIAQLYGQQFRQEYVLVEINQGHQVSFIPPHKSPHECN
jgi:hypothetical protein